MASHPLNDNFNLDNITDNQKTFGNPDRQFSVGLKEEDSIMYSNVMNFRDDDQEFLSIRVSDPHRQMGDQVIYYKIIAYDCQGQFQCKRRYSDFESLWSAWKKRLPGLYYPFLPPKKIFGNTDRSHLEERCFLLEQFLRKVYKIAYLV